MSLLPCCSCSEVRLPWSKYFLHKPIGQAYVRISDTLHLVVPNRMYQRGQPRTLVPGRLALPAEFSEMLTGEDCFIESIGLHVFDDAIQRLTEAEGVKPAGLRMRTTPNFQPLDSPVNCPE